jgi:uncharacterized protein YceK
MQRLLSLSFLVFGGLSALMLLTNPSSSASEQYAAEQVNDYMKNNVCSQKQAGIGEIFQSQCKLLIDTASPQLSKLIATKTHRQNFFLFSLYQTELSFPSPLPSYQINTVGVFDRFFIYQTEQI